MGVRDVRNVCLGGSEDGTEHLASVVGGFEVGDVGVAQSGLWVFVAATNLDIGNVGTGANQVGRQRVLQDVRIATTGLDASTHRNVFENVVNLTP